MVVNSVPTLVRNDGEWAVHVANPLPKILAAAAGPPEAFGALPDAVANATPWTLVVR